MNDLSNATALVDSLDSTIFDSTPRRFTRTKIYPKTLLLPLAQGSKDRFGLIGSGHQEADRGHQQREVKAVRFVGTREIPCLPRVSHRLGQDTARAAIYEEDHLPWSWQEIPEIDIRRKSIAQTVRLASMDIVLIRPADSAPQHLRLSPLGRIVHVGDLVCNRQSPLILALRVCMALELLDGDYPSLRRVTHFNRLTETHMARPFCRN